MKTLTTLCSPYLRYPCSSIRHTSIYWLAIVTIVFGISVFDIGTFDNSVQAEDRIEFLSGANLKGTVTKIDADGKTVKFEATIAGRKTIREFRYAQIHAVTYRGKRYILTAKTAKPPRNSSTDTSNGSDNSNKRSKSEVEKLISGVGSTKPDWFDSTPASLPKSLDLSFPLKPPNKSWNNQVNVGQYIWDVVNPNPNRWKTGIVMMYQIMDGHRGNQQLLTRDKKTLAGMYFRLFQDYPRAAYWQRQANVQKGTPDSIMIGECYFRMGNKAMAMEMLNSRQLTSNAIKLLGDIGETQRAVQLAELYAKAGRHHQAYLMAGDACRLDGKYSQAISLYEKVLGGNAARNKDHEKMFHGRARDSIASIKHYELLDVSKLSDGKYTSQSPGYSGNVAVEVTIVNKQIADVKVTKHQEKQFYSALKDTTAQIIDKQGVKGVDTTSRATITSAAIINAAAKAMAK
jgi:uncharacterized protein with FMN-binding domain